MEHVIIAVGLTSFVLGAAVATLVCLLALPRESS